MGREISPYIYGGVEEFGRPRLAHNQKTAGSNPASATMARLVYLVEFKKDVDYYKKGEQRILPKQLYFAYKPHLRLLKIYSSLQVISK